MAGRRSLLPLLLVLPCFYLIALPLAATEESANDRALAGYLEVWSSGEVDLLDDLVTADFQRHAGPQESPASRAELKGLIGQTQRLYRRLRFEVAESFTTVDGGAMHGLLRGGYKDTDRAVRIPVMALYRFRDGKLAEEWMLANNLPTLIGLSFTVAPPGYEIVPPETASTPSAPNAAAAEEE